MRDRFEKPNACVSSENECFPIRIFKRLSVSATSFLKEPCPVALTGVNCLAWVFQQNQFVLVYLPCSFLGFGPVYEPIFERRRMMVKMVMTNRHNFCFVSCFSNASSKSAYGLEFQWMRRESEAVGRQRNASIQKQFYIWSFNISAHGPDPETLS